MVDINARQCKWENSLVCGYFSTKARKNKYEKIQREKQRWGNENNPFSDKAFQEEEVVESHPESGWKAPKPGFCILDLCCTERMTSKRTSRSPFVIQLFSYF